MSWRLCFSTMERRTTPQWFRIITSAGMWSMLTMKSFSKLTNPQTKQLESKKCRRFQKLGGECLSLGTEKMSWRKFRHKSKSEGSGFMSFSVTLTIYVKAVSRLPFSKESWMEILELNFQLKTWSSFKKVTGTLQPKKLITLNSSRTWSILKKSKGLLDKPTVNYPGSMPSMK